MARRFALLLHEHRLEATKVEGGRGIVHPAIHEVEVVRRGFQDSWDIDRVRGLRRGVAERFGYASHSAAANHFVPDRLSLTGLDAGLAWRLEAELDDEGYTRWDGATEAAPAQVARFREGDSLVVALAADLGATGLVESGARFEGRSPQDDAGLPEGIVARQGPLREVVGTGRAYFVTSEGPDHAAALDPAPVRERVVFAATLPPRAQVGGLEVFTPGATARYRQVIRPLGAEDVGLSDLLLFRPFGLERPGTRARAIALMHGSLRVPRDRELGVYWEAYGLPADEVVQVSVTLEGDEGGWLTRLGQAVGVAGGRADRTISWTEETGGVRPFAQSFTLQLGGVEEGEIGLTFRVEMEDGRILSRTRRLEIVEG